MSAGPVPTGPQAPRHPAAVALTPHPVTQQLSTPMTVSTPPKKVGELTCGVTTMVSTRPSPVRQIGWDSLVHLNVMSVVLGSRPFLVTYCSAWVRA